MGCKQGNKNCDCKKCRECNKPTFSNNPQSVYNGMLSGYRNMFLSSTVAIALIGFSEKFKNPKFKFTISIIGGIVLFLSLYISLLIANDFKFYLDTFDKLFPDHIPVEQWRMHFYTGYIYGAILLILGFGFFMKKFFGRVPF
jgi:hypothetical protein